MKIFLGVLLLAGSSTLACKPALPSGYDVGAGSSAAPPDVRIAKVSVSLGNNYGAPGPGDCSELGTVEIALDAPKGRCSMDAMERSWS